MKNKFINFIHIERAGSTSLHHLLHYNFNNYKTINPRHLYTNNTEAYFSKDKLNKLLKYYPKLEGIGGHTTRSFLNYDEILNKDIFYFTFLREPISRYMSHLNYQQQVMNIDWDIEEFINNEYFNNFQTKRIIGNEGWEQAYNELLRYSFVGLSEEYNQSLLMLSQKIDWCNFNPLYEKKNEIPSISKNIKFDDLSIDIQNKIMLNNELDIKLYNKVKTNIYKQQKENYIGNIDKDIVEYNQKLQNFKYSKIKSFKIKIKKAIFYYLIEKTIFE